MVDRGLNDKRPCETERGAALADDPDRCVATDLDGNGSKHADTAIGREIADARRQPEEVLVAGTTLPKLRIDAARPAEDIGESGLTVAQLLFERDPVRGQRGVVSARLELAQAEFVVSNAGGHPAILYASAVKVR